MKSSGACLVFVSFSSALFIGCAEERPKKGTKAEGAASGIRGVCIGFHAPGPTPGPDKKRLEPNIKIAVLADGKALTHTVSDAKGAFAVVLEPGKYLLRNESRQCTPWSQEVVVEAGRFTEIRIELDCPDP
ncbi:MAG: carboxypeptidase-like regulatory domain-containing protein [Gemmataceae bacterium]